MSEIVNVGSLPIASSATFSPLYRKSKKTIFLPAASALFLGKCTFSLGVDPNFLNASLIYFGSFHT
ncbi:MAG TPA: hypothetical protein VFC80_01390, partial [Sphaerochaeta sp.]|nr:hypothetical protein [Sphaerochaeta sp.]